MSDKEPAYTLDNLPDDIPANPGWKPLAWFAGIILLLIGLGEVLVVFGWELLELIGEGIFLAVEGSEEFLEDAVEGWFGLEPWEAEMYTAWVTSPIKLVLAFFILRAIWRWKKRKVLPAAKRWLARRWLIIRLSWRGLWWPWKAGVMSLGVGLLFILI
ncbi:hypothetical protein [Methylococcus sp. EFPC2]|uniref:hypothetical protein n=1 Tax=Methylococcus sp. EFPC2 TaxID=2812648 RepID=UPI001967329B|nr:hypothetical protein [Methylococcus sp. EFPC2]QSA96674.1 hypothetical protein JWZ97_15885 [Methylococcus sp. EFPC2]